MPPSPLNPRQLRRARVWMTLVLVGLIIFIVGVDPDLIGLDRTPVVGFLQISVWLIGLGLLIVGAYGTVHVVRNGRPNSLRADIGVRLLATGYVAAAVASLADHIGIGSDPLPDVFFGPLQVIGLAIGVGLCIVGVVLYWPIGKEEPPGESEN